MSEISIIFGGPVKVVWANEDGSVDKEITDEKVIKKFHNIVYSEDNDQNNPTELSVYLRDGRDSRYPHTSGIRKGIFKYFYYEHRKELWLLAEYSTEIPPDENVINDLLRFTNGQFFDGAGEHFSAQLYDLNAGTAPLGHPKSNYLLENIGNIGLPPVLKHALEDNNHAKIDRIDTYLFTNDFCEYFLSSKNQEIKSRIVYELTHLPKEHLDSLPIVKHVMEKALLSPETEDQYTALCYLVDETYMENKLFKTLGHEKIDTSLYSKEEIEHLEEEQLTIEVVEIDTELLKLEVKKYLDKN